MARRGASRPPRYRDASLDPGERAGDLCRQLSLTGKLQQLGGCWARDLHDGEGFCPVRGRERLGEGIGHITRIGGSTGLLAQDSAEFANAIQRFLAEETEHGIPAIIHEEGVSGYCARGATQFPQAIGQAASFNTALVRRAAAVVGEQLRAVGARQVLAPVLDVARDPRWGRLEETYGEDPYLCARMGVAYVRGVQGDVLETGVAATGKHFVGYGLPEGGMNHAPVQLGPRQLREVYVEPFAAAIREAELASVMNGYHSVDGLPCAAAPELLRTLLRDELHFDGVVVADYFAVELLQRHHRVAATPLQAAQLAIAAGIDVELPTRDCYGAELESWLESDDPGAGALTARVDEAVTRVLRLKFALGLFEEPFVAAERASACFDTADQRALAEELAAESIVLLENDGVLPLAPTQQIALIGPTADDARALLGDYSYPAHLEVAYTADTPSLAPVGPHPSADAALVSGTEGAAASDLSPTGEPASCFEPGPYYVPITSLKDALAARSAVAHAVGCALDGEPGAELASIRDAIAVARTADVICVAVGGRSGLTRDASSGEFRDATDLRLTGNQETLIDRLLALGKPVIVAVLGGRAFDLSAFNGRVNALLHAWLPGEAGGQALASILLGERSPSGRLPVSLARSAGQVPLYHGPRSGGGRSMIYRSYTDCDNKPLYAFGHGLSYGALNFGPLEGPAVVDSFGVVVVSLEVENAGAVEGCEVVQLYLSDELAAVARPVKQLVGFVKVTLAPGQRARVSFHVDASAAAYFDPAMELVVDPGTIRFRAGPASDRLPSELAVEIEGDRRRLQQHQLVATQVAVKVL
ncbi:MAG: glycoside hydrolase family 3 N-terminal domain-containing protein [Pseudomonadota bacterium]